MNRERNGNGRQDCSEINLDRFFMGVFGDFLSAFSNAAMLTCTFFIESAIGIENVGCCLTENAFGH